jgi:two-component system response regulator
MNRPTDWTILYAEDDPDDRLLAEMAHRDSGVVNPLVFVRDGEEALEYLRCTGRHADRAGGPQPGIVLLDLNMPGMDGLEILRTMKTDALLRRIPVLILTTSASAKDIAACYDAGANSYTIKPTAFASLVALFELLCRYWFGAVSLGLEVNP